MHLRWITPFVVASAGLLSFFGYIFWVEFFGPNASPHGVGVLFGMLSLGTAFVLFGVDRLLVKRMTPGYLWIVEIIVLGLLYSYFIS